MDHKKLTSMEIDAIGEILNISLGASATAVSTMLNARVDITTPIVQVKSKEEFEFSNLEPAVGVEITYVEGLTGSNIMLLKRKDVKVIVEMLMGTEISDEDFELNEMNISAICEVMNQMMGASSTALSELLAKTVNISTPVSFEVESTEQFKEKYFTEEDAMAVIGFDLKIGDQMESQFMNLMPINLARELVSEFFPEGMAGEEEPPAAETPVAQPTQPEPSGGGDQMMSQEEIQALFASQQEPQEAAPAQEEPEPSGDGKTMSQEEIQALFASQQEPSAPPAQEPAPQQPVAAPAAAPTQPAPAPQAAPSADTTMMQQMMDMMRQQMEMQQQQIEQLQKSASRQPPKQIKVSSPPQPSLRENNEEFDPDANLDLIMGVPLDISVEIGRTKKLVKDILELNKGSLVVLDKLAGEQVDVFVNGQCIAKGDVVVVDDSFGVRITEIVQEELIVE